MKPHLIELAEEYHRRCELYDRTVCTGPIRSRLGVMPTSTQEIKLCSANAAKIGAELFAGYAREDVRRAIKEVESYFDGSAVNP